MPAPVGCCPRCWERLPHGHIVRKLVCEAEKTTTDPLKATLLIERLRYALDLLWRYHESQDAGDAVTVADVLDKELFRNWGA